MGDKTAGGRAGGGRVFLPNLVYCGEARVVMWPGSGSFQGREGIRRAVWGQLGLVELSTRQSEQVARMKDRQTMPETRAMEGVSF